MNSISEWAKVFSRNIWDRLSFVHATPHARLYETTITDELVFQFFLEFHCKGFGNLLRHASNEKRNGNDLEIAIEIEKGVFLIFPIQAKRLYGNRKYQRLGHKGQIKSLLSYAQEIGGIPLYLMYNYYEDILPIPKKLKESYNITKEDYGCSLINANYIYANYSPWGRGKSKWKIPLFEDLHPTTALPWYLLFNNPELFINAPDNLFNNKLGFPITRYSEREVENLENWIPVLIPKESEKSTSLQTSSNEIRSSDDEISSFSPGFRLVINMR